MKSKKPTLDECRTKAIVYEDDNRIGHAMLYPQMGGYRALSIVFFDKMWKERKDGFRQGGCIDICIWHDGEFPFNDENPKWIHHCDPEQFISFGETLRDINNKNLQII